MNDYSEYPRVKFIRLDNGDDLLAEVIEVGDDDNFLYHLVNPLKVLYIPSEKQGYYVVSFMPWVFPRMVDIQEFTLQVDKVVIICDASDKMNSYYWESIHDTLRPPREITPEEQSTLDTDEFTTKRVYH